MFKTSYTTEEFDKLGDYILNNIIINSNGTKFRLCEIEFYYWSEKHKDEYVHKSPDQKQYGKFYFHKFRNGTYKSGTFRGIDIVLGNDQTFFGILIRSIKNIETNEFTEGSCNVANKFLSCFNVSTVKELFEKYYSDVEQISINSNRLKLEKNTLDRETVFSGPRIGLSDKYPEFKDKKYRYAIFIDKIKKQRKTFTLLHQDIEPIEIKENNKLYVVCNCTFGEQVDIIRVFNNKNSALEWINTFEEKTTKDFIKLDKVSGKLYEQDDMFGYESIKLFEIPNETGDFHIFDSWCDTGYGGNSTIYYADSRKGILQIAKEDIFGTSEWINSRFEEYCVDMPDEDSQSIIDDFNKDNLDPKNIYTSLLENEKYQFKDVYGNFCGWDLFKKKIRT
jgi:hypothetical protein